jgi:hypothetical protein
MSKFLEAAVINTLITEVSKGIRVAWCSVAPANYAGIAAVKLMEGTLTAGNGSAGVDGTVGSYTFAAGATNAQGLTGRKVTVAALTALTAAATGIATHAVIHDNSARLLYCGHAGVTTNTGTAQAGAASTITLAAGASAVDSTYNGYGVRITSGPGVGQDRIISSYVGSTKVATISSAWTVQPTSASVYEVFGLALTNAGTYNTVAFPLEIPQIG